MKVINWDSNTIIRIQLWDIAGEFTLLSVYDLHGGGHNIVNII